MYWFNSTLLLLLFSYSLSLSAQEKTFTVLEYNVENLFDTLHDYGKDDYTFLPNGKKKWDSRKYWKKLGRLAVVLAAAGYPAPADLIGLCEVENDSVIADLTQRTRLRQLGYEAIVTQSNDPRGVDVALLFQPLRFQPLEHRSLRVPPPTLDHKATRDILYVKGQLPQGDTLHVFLCHFPSKASGRKSTDSYRAAAAQVLKDFTDSLLALCPTAHLLLMGDFNDEAESKALRGVLGSLPPPLHEEMVQPQHLYTLSHRLTHPSGAKGSYYFRGTWSQIDHFIVSSSLLQASSSLYTKAQHCELLCLPFLYETDRTGLFIRPKRTYLGDYYHGGCSDHFPLRLRFTYRYP